ncbi:hypothetical protein ACP4OV_010343 [Aristida adscensionis]
MQRCVLAADKFQQILLPRHIGLCPCYKMHLHHLVDEYACPPYQPKMHHHHHHHHHLAAALQLLLALGRIVSCSSTSPPVPPPSDDVVSYSFAALDDRPGAGGLVVATSSSILSPAAFLFDAQLFPGLNRSEGFLLLSRPVHLWRADAGAGAGSTPAATREASFNTTFTVDGGASPSPLSFVVLLDSIPPLASTSGALGGLNAASTPHGGAVCNASGSLAAVEVGAVGAYGPESPDVGLNVTVKLNGTAPPRSTTVWVEYNAVTHHLRVFTAAAGDPRPLKPLVDDPLNLAGGHTTQNAFVGFFAATVQSVVHGVKNWELTLDKFPGSDCGDEEDDDGSVSALWLLILLPVLGFVAAMAGVSYVVVRYSQIRRRALEMEQIMKESYPHPRPRAGLNNT